MASGRSTGIDLDTTKIGSFSMPGAQFWARAIERNLSFAYLKFFTGLTPPSALDAQYMIWWGALYGAKGLAKGERIDFGPYCVLDPSVSGKEQAAAFVNYMVDKGMFRNQAFIDFYRLRPALWLPTQNSSSHIVEEALDWLDTVYELYADLGIDLKEDPLLVAAPFDYLSHLDLSPLAGRCALWVMDQSRDSIVKDKPRVPSGFNADLWQKDPDRDFLGYAVGFNEAIYYKPVEPEPKRGWGLTPPLVSLALMGGLIGAAYWLSASEAQRAKAEATKPSWMRGSLL